MKYNVQTVNAISNYRAFQRAANKALRVATCGVLADTLGQSWTEEAFISAFTEDGTTVDVYDADCGPQSLFILPLEDLQALGYIAPVEGATGRYTTC